MIELLTFLQEDCPIFIKEQLISMMRHEWPQAFEGMGEHVLWPENPATQPTSFILIEDNIVISHVAVPWKYIKHEDHTYKVFGLSEVMTNPSYRHQGFGLKLVKEATSYISKSDADIGMYTCQPALVSFYTQGGWEHIQNTNLIGGTRDKPFRSDALGLSTMMRFFSDTAQQHRSDFEATDVYLELGEKMLW